MRHLNDEEFTQILIGDDVSGSAAGQANTDVPRMLSSAAPAWTHLRLCTRCQQEVASMREAMLDLRAASTSWSEQQAATLHRHSAVLEPRRLEKWMERLSLSGDRSSGPRLALAAAILAVFVPAGVYTNLRHAQHEAQRQAALHAAQSALDDALLNAVHRELAEEVAPAMQPLMVSQPATSADDLATGQNR